jgi:hypothetical protein
MDRVEKQTGVAITQTDVSTVTYEIYDVDDNGVRDSGALTKTSVIFNALQTTDPDWTVDATGYNFMTKWPASSAPPESRVYRYKVKITLTDGSICFLLRDRSARIVGGNLT